MRNLGIAAALKSEARTLATGPLPVNTAIQFTSNTLLWVSGLGATRARAAAESLLAEGATALLSWGSAGGLAASLLPGNLILPKTIISSGRSVFAVEAEWHERLSRLLSGYQAFHTGPLAESPTVLANPTEKKAFGKQYGAMAVDMESAAVAQVAGNAQVPFMVIRAVVDPIEMILPVSALQAIDEHGRVRPLSLMSGLLRNPAELFLLLRLSQNFRKALFTLETVAHLAGDKLFGL